MGAFYNSEEIFLPKNIKVCQNLLTFVPRHGDKKSVPCRATAPKFRRAVLKKKLWGFQSLFPVNKNTLTTDRNVF